MDGRGLARLDARSIAITFVLLISAAGTVPVFGAPAYPGVIEEQQPDGSVVQLRVRGDEHFSWMEDTHGFTVLKQAGWYKYAERDPNTGRLRATSLLVGKSDPRAAGLKERTLPSPAIRAQSRKTDPQYAGGGKGKGGGGNDPEPPPPEGVAPAGTVKNLVVLVRFNDHQGRALPSRADVDVLFNAVGGDPVLAPTGSVRDVYYENSYGQMVLDSDVQDWVTVSGTEAYYANGNSGDSTLWQALRQALNAIDASVNFNDYDTDNDGWIDAIAFIHSGYAAEWGGTDAYGAYYTDRIWSHRWSLNPSWQSAEGVRVGSYHISPGVWGLSGSDIGRIGVIAHETGHFFGLPDLYDTDASPGDGIGSWGLMANSWDFNWSQRCPPHFSPWSKVRLGWYAPTVISAPGTYAINEAEHHPEVYRINANYPANEYLMIENRQATGFDCSIPQGGLVIWHIDENAGYNTQGYPGQTGWPGNGNHYKVAVLQADGNFDLEKGNNRGDAGDTHHALGVDAIGPGPGNHPNTDAYQSGNVYQTGHMISNISVAGPTMTFCLQSCGGGLNPPSSLVANALSASSIGLTWVDNSTSETGFRLERSLNGSNWSLRANLGANVQAFTDTALNAGTTYYYRVRAHDASQSTAWSNTASATTQVSLPAAPSNLQASAVSESRIDLSWQDNAGNETGYHVQRSLNQSSWMTVANLPANSTSYQSLGLASSTTYYFRVAATNGAGSSAWASAQATTHSPPDFVDYVAQQDEFGAGTVSGTHVDTRTDNGQAQEITERESGGRKRDRYSYLEHTWRFSVNSGSTATLYVNAWSSGSSDNDGFVIAWSNNGQQWNDLLTVTSTDDSNVQMASLPNNINGTVHVRVRDTDRTAGNRSPDRISVDHLYIRVENGAGAGNPPAAPSALDASTAGARSVDLAWSDNATDEMGFQVERSPDGVNGWQQVASVAADLQAWTDTELLPETQYFYRVRAFNGNGNSAWTGVDGATTDAETGGNIQLSASGFRRKGVQNVTLDWVGATSANVDVWRDGQKVATVPNDGQHTDNLGKKGSGDVYAYKVCEAGTAACSNQITVVF